MTDVLHQFVVRAGAPLLGADSQELDEQLRLESNQTVLRTFCEDLSAPVLLLLHRVEAEPQRSGSLSEQSIGASEAETDVVPAEQSADRDSDSSDSDSDSDSDQEGSDVFELSCDSKRLARATDARNAVAFVKNSDKPLRLKGKKSLARQLHVMQLHAGAPLHSMLAFVRHSFLPLSRDMVVRAGSDDSRKEHDKSADTKVALRAIAGKFFEIETELLRCAGDIQVPSVSLQVHSALRNVESLEQLGALADDVAFANAVQKDLVEWRRLIRSVTTLKRSITRGSLAQEVNFWHAMQRAVQQVESQLQRSDVTLAFELLRRHKRFVVTTNFRGDVLLGEVHKRIETNLSMMSEFPVHELQHASDLPALARAADAAVQHVRSKAMPHGRIAYPPQQLLGLLRCLSRDVAARMCHLLSEQQVLRVDMDHFRVLKSACELTHAKMRSIMAFLTDYGAVAAQQQRSTASTSASTASTSTATGELMFDRLEFDEVKAVLTRLQEVLKVRQAHVHLLRHIRRTFGLSGESADAVTGRRWTAAVEQAFGDNFLSLADPLRVHVAEGAAAAASPEDDPWKRACRRYDKCVEDIELELEQRIRDELLAVTEGEAGEWYMFRVFQKYYELLARPRIGQAFVSYHGKLLQVAQHELRRLQLRHRRRFLGSQAHTWCVSKDVPPVAAHVLWCQQLRRRVEHLARQLRGVLGRRWSEIEAPRGKQLRQAMDVLLRKLDTRALVEQWQQQAKLLLEHASDRVGGPVLCVVRAADGEAAAVATGDGDPGAGMQLAVNLDRRLVELFKECRLLMQHGVRSSWELRSAALLYQQMQPVAVRLDDAVCTYRRLCDVLARPESVRVRGLLQQHKRRVQHRLLQAKAFCWLTSSHSFNARTARYAADLCGAVAALDDRVGQVLRLDALVQQCLQALEDCELPHTAAAVGDAADTDDDASMSGSSSVADGSGMSGDEDWFAQRQARQSLAARVKSLDAAQLLRLLQREVVDVVDEGDFSNKQLFVQALNDAVAEV
ncbi:MAG: hypothetical protein MHM6MM_004633, partial [Cercozoa sp. M6MM]